jgi:thiol reductant ABC exporter CydD subunit
VSPTRRLLALARSARLALVAAVMLGVAAAALAVVQAGLLAHLIASAFLGGAGLDDMMVPVALLAGVFGARSLVAWASEVTAQRISGRVKSGLRVQLLAQAVALGPRWAAGTRSAEVTLLATRGLDALDAYFGRYLPQVALAALIPPTVVVCLALVDGVAALTVALTVPLIPVFMVLVGRMSAAHRRRRWAALSRLAYRFGDVVAGLPTLRAYGRSEAQISVLRRITDTYRTTTMGTLRVAFLSALVLELLATIAVALVAVGVGLRLAYGEMTLFAGLFAIILAPEAYLPLRRLGAEFHASEEGVTAAAKAFAIIDAALPGGGSVAPPAALEALAVRELTVDQPGREVRAPHAATFTARPGEVVALTGPSGCGKSTTLLAILGLVAPSDGDVVARAPDGAETSVSALDGTAWRARVAWVPQAPYLFAGTVAENVRLGAPGASDAAVEAALADVGLADVPAAQMLGESGAGLSSGQRRRVGIARALVRGAPVLLLDEPTAGLDADAEAAVLAAVRREAARGAIVVLVAHRPGAVAGADRVVEIGWQAVEPAAAAVTEALTEAPAIEAGISA